MSVKKPPAASPNGPPAKASVIRRLDGAEESSHDRLVKKHVPAWVISGAVHVGVIALAILIFGTRATDAKVPEKIVTTTVEKPDDVQDKDLTNEDPGLQSDLAAALPEQDRIADMNVAAAETSDPIGTPNAMETDTTSLAPPGLAPSDSANAGVSGDTGFAKAGEGGAQGMMFATFPGRSGATKSKLLAEGGGNAESERAVALGLAWLARQQRDAGNNVGFWEFDAGDKARATATGLALLPFLAAGQTHRVGKYQAVVLRGLNYLVSQVDKSKDPGHIANAGGHYMYSHAIITMALCEAFGMTKDKPLLLPSCQATINYIQRAQHSEGGWRYQPNQAGDTSVVGWQIQALKAGAMSKEIVVDDKVIKKANEFLDRVGGGSRKATYGYTAGPGAPGTSMTAVGLLCRYYISGWGPSNGAMAEGVEGIMKKGPRAGGTVMDNVYYYYYATQVVHFFEGPEWKNWNEGNEKDGKRAGGMRDWLISLQVKKDGPNMGSWDAENGSIGKSTGRLGTTCFSLLTLEVYYRHLPLYKRDTGGVKVLDGLK